MSKIEEFETEPQLELLTELSTVSLIGFPEIYPYTHAEIKIEFIDIEHLKPSAFYVLEENLQRILHMFKELTEKEIDIFDLNKLVSYREFNLCPPIVEIVNEEAVLIDGLHRTFIARQLGYKSIKVIRISGVTVPLAVMPLRWQDVKIETKIPQVKRIYNPEIEEGMHGKFYRDFSRFGSTGERKPQS